jgi:hypothetical protein
MRGLTLQLNTGCVYDGAMYVLYDYVDDLVTQCESGDCSGKGAVARCQ